MLRCCMIEPARKADCGSIGAHYITRSARDAGHTVDVIDYDSGKAGYDVELISIHHPSDYQRLVNTPRHGAVRIIGGHVTFNNPRPLIHHTDYICMGDGESWIVEALSQLESTGIINLPGTIISKGWVNGSPMPDRNYLPKIAPQPYLNRPGTRSAAWYIEIARGCPFYCSYCELGHSMPYRFTDTCHVERVIDNLDKSVSKKIVFFAPDEASHPDYDGLLLYAKKAGFRQGFGSYRLDQVLKKGGVQVASNQLVRVGIDGLTEKTRDIVGKSITNQQIIDYFSLMTSRGHTSYKIFQMFAHSWESIIDFDEWESIMDRVVRIPTAKNCLLRVKWTPLIPQSITPLGEDVPEYSHEMVERIMLWHEKMKLPKREPGWFVKFDGLMSKKTHSTQVAAAAGGEHHLE